MDDSQILPQHIAALAAGEHGGRLFLQEIDGDEISYRETDRRARAWASFYRDLGVQPGDAVATMLPTRIPTILSWLGLSWLRAVDVGVNKELRGRLLAYTLENSTARVLVTSRDYLDELRAVLGEVPAIDTVVLIDGPVDDGGLPVRIVASPGETAVAPGAEAFEPPALHDLSSVLYTSGTTGPSKGVRVPWGHLLATALNSIPQPYIGPDDAMYTPYAMHHVTGKAAVYTIALAGGRCVLREQFKTDRYWDDVERYRCTCAVLMGVMADFLYRQPGPDPFETPMRYMTVTPLIPQIEDFKRRFGVLVRTCFNMTEVSVPVTTPEWELFDTRSAGRVRPGAQVRIVDEHDRVVPHGEIGEIVVRADDPWTMNDGYWNMPDKTVEAWRNLWFHSGDAGWRDPDGNFYFVDRIKDAIRRRGVNISSAELEQEVLACPEVAEVAAIGVASEHLEQEVKVVVVRAPGSALTAQALSAFLEERVPRYMRPRYIQFADTLPKTPTHKVKKAELRAQGVTDHTWDRLAARPGRVPAA